MFPAVVKLFKDAEKKGANEAEFILKVLAAAPVKVPPPLFKPVPAVKALLTASAVAALPAVSASISSVWVVTNVWIWSAVANAAPPFAIAAVFADSVNASAPLNVVPEFNLTVALSTVNAAVVVPTAPVTVATPAAVIETSPLIVLNIEPE